MLVFVSNQNGEALKFSEEQDLSQDLLMAAVI